MGQVDGVEQAFKTGQAALQMQCAGAPFLQAGVFGAQAGVAFGEGEMVRYAVLEAAGEVAGKGVDGQHRRGDVSEP